VLQNKKSKMSMKKLSIAKGRRFLYESGLKSCQATSGFCKNGHRFVSVYPPEGLDWAGMTQAANFLNSALEG
jgi:hypothetical protein